MKPVRWELGIAASFDSTGQHQPVDFKLGGLSGGEIPKTGNLLAIPPHYIQDREARCAL
ncbi:hypothetical protein Rcae01_04978 [Novipirellula caenicola]|uniref:Uncharacterized protein n=1 Tax=Novipirellula caenicola TaxID=1536901 RepID=A0ABP9VWG0_9BACT